MMRNALRVVLTICVCLFVKVNSNFIIIKPVPQEANATILLEAWRNADQLVVETTEQILKMVFPHLTRLTIASELGTECAGSLLKLMRGIKNQDDWAFKMLDASSKGLVGFYSGNVGSFGSFDQCLNIAVPDPYSSGQALFSGKYCTVDFRLLMPVKKRYNRDHTILEPFQNLTFQSSIIRRILSIGKFGYFMSLRFGVCVPSTCTTDDMNKLLKQVSDKMGVLADVNRCEVKEENVFQTDQIAVIVVLALFVVLCLIGTAVDVIPTYLKNKEDPDEFPIWRKVLLAFSMETNLTKFLNTDKVNEKSLPALHGMKFLSMTWVIIGHSYLQINWHLVRELDVVRKEVRKFEFQAIINAYMSVDTFFFITGLLVCYITLSTLEIIGYHRFNTFIFIVRRIWRLLPTTMMVIGITILIPLFGSGPVWHDTFDLVVNNCRKNWWANVIFVNNFLRMSDMCLPQTWYTATDMQLYFLALIFLMLLFRKPLYAIVFGVSLILVSIVSTAAINVYMDFPPTVLQSTQDPEEMVEMYDFTQFKPHTHVSPYAIGLLIGYLIHIAHKNKFRIREHVQFFLWITSIVVAFSVLYGTYEWNRDKVHTFVESIMYSALFRTAWVLSISWMTFACCTGRGGIVNRILTWKVVIPLSRLTFLAYLLHILVLWYYVGNMRGTADGRQLIAVWNLLSTIVVTYFLAFICHIIFDAPFQELEKVFLKAVFASKLKKMQPGTDQFPPKESSPGVTWNNASNIDKDKTNNVVTIHTIESQFEKPTVFTGFGRRLNGEIAKDGPEGTFRHRVNSNGSTC